MKVGFSAEGRTTNLKISNYTPSIGEIFKELEPIVAGMIATGEAKSAIGPVTISLREDDEKNYLFNIDYELGTLMIAKGDLIKRTQLTIQDGLQGLVEQIDEISEEKMEEAEREALIEEADEIGAEWNFDMTIGELQEAIALKKLDQLEAAKRLKEKTLAELNGDELIDLALKLGVASDLIDATETDDELRAIIENKIKGAAPSSEKCAQCKPATEPLCQDPDCQPAEQARKVTDLDHCQDFNKCDPCTCADELEEQEDVQ